MPEKTEDENGKWITLPEKNICRLQDIASKNIQTTIYCGFFVTLKNISMFRYLGVALSVGLTAQIKMLSAMVWAEKKLKPILTSRVSVSSD